MKVFTIEKNGEILRGKATMEMPLLLTENSKNTKEYNEYWLLYEEHIVSLKSYNASAELQNFLRHKLAKGFTELKIERMILSEDQLTITNIVVASNTNKTIEQAADEYSELFRYKTEEAKGWKQSKVDDFISGALWQQQEQSKMFTKEELIDALLKYNTFWMDETNTELSEIEMVRNWVDKNLKK